MADKHAQVSEPTEVSGGDTATLVVKNASPKKQSASSPVQIIKMTADNGFQLVEENLKKILLQPAVAKLPVVVVSIAGPFRLGKSFMLNYFLQYLSQTTGDEETWESPISPTQEGFHWAHGAERDTTGIWMLEAPIIRKVKGKKVAVLLVDTQGTFDNQTTNQMNSVVFALNSLLSSIQIYNISKRIGEDILQHMHMFTKFGQMAFDEQVSTESEKKKEPFQTLTFLIRDWGGKKDFPFGHSGGEDYLTSVLKSTDDEAKIELKEVRRDIKNCFQDLSCFLMPHPGEAVAEGDSGEVSDRFGEYLNEFVPLTLKNENLVPKMMLGEAVTCENLFAYIKAYVEIFQDKAGQLPEVSSVFEATAKLNHQNLMYASLSSYKTSMDSYAGVKAPYRDPEVLEIKHKESMATSVLHYGDAPRLSSERIEKEARATLKEKIEEKYAEICASNESKALLTVLKTPITCGGLALASNILGTFLSLLGFTTFALLLSYLTWVSLLTIAFWSYSTQSGQFGDATKQIDEYARVIYDLVQGLIRQYLMGEVIAAATNAATKKRN